MPLTQRFPDTCVSVNVWVRERVCEGCVFVCVCVKWQPWRMNWELMSSSVPDDYCWWDIEWTDGVPWFHVWQEVTLNMPHLRVWQKHTSVELTVLYNPCYLWQWHTGVVQRCSNLFIPGCDFTTLLNHLLPRLSFSVICICPQWSCSGSAVHVYVRAFLICLHLHDMVFSSLWKICVKYKCFVQMNEWINRLFSVMSPHNTAEQPSTTTRNTFCMNF